ncbi:MAG: CHAT domain-containing protein [Tildeniella nuda ZEHNDER 1965/U140]|nr:CHAT domain-containing protein [Tildeniella nuda ZEHNDER 1965/U140]
MGRSHLWAQSTTKQDRKAEADRLFEQGTKQFEQNQNEAAIASFQKALSIYQELKERQKEGQVLKAIGNAYLNLKNYAKSLGCYQQALIIAREIKESDLESRVLNNMGLVHQRLKQIALATVSFEESIKVAQNVQNFKMVLLASSNLGSLYEDAKKYEKAAVAYQQAVDAARKAENLQQEVKNLLNIANVSFYVSTSEANYQNIVELTQQGLKLAQNIHDAEQESRALAILGNTYKYLKDYQKAIEFYKQSVTAAKEAKNEWRETLILNAIGELYLYSLENYDDAAKYAQQALLVARKIGNRSLESTSLSLLGNSLNNSGAYQEAINYQLEALAIDREIKDRNSEARDLLNISASYWSSRNYQKSIESSLQSLAIAQQIKNRYFEALALTELGANTWGLNDYGKGIGYNQQALEIYQALKDYDKELLVLHNLNSNYLYLGDYQKVDEYSKRILDLGRKVKNREFEGTALAFLGFSYFGQGNLQKALEYGQQALVIAQETNSPRSECFALLVLSSVYSNYGNYNKALELAQQSLTAARKPKVRQQHVSLEGLALNILGTLYRKTGQVEKAIATYRGSLVNNTTDSAAAQVGLARTYRSLNLPITAITYYKQALTEVEQVRRKISRLPRPLQASFLKASQVDDRVENADIYRELADLLLSQGRILEAQQVLELLKSQEIRDFTRAAKAETTTPNVPLTPKEGQILDKSNSLIAFGVRVDACQQKSCSQLDQLLNQRDALNQQFDQQVEGIEKEYRDREVKDRTTLAPQDFLPQAQQIVEAQPGTILIYPLVLENKTWLLWASRGVVVKSIELPNIGQRQLGETVLKFRQLLQNPNANPDEVKAVSKQLYDWLLKPIEPELKANQIQNLVFSLDRATRYIPMSALFDGEKYLLERYTVSTILSAGYTDMSGQPSPSTQSTKVLALGLSDAKAGFNALPNVPAELDAIVHQSKSDKQGIYPGLKLLNAAFNFPALRRYLGRYQIIHIATHGKFEPTNPEKSFLVLGDGNPLAIPRIRTLQNLRNVYLVVLSACETALGGADQDGVEIAGISSYFLQKGRAKAVMASLWNVNDASTSRLMQQFYKNLATGKMTKAEALRQAQLSLMNGKMTTKDAPARSDIIVTETRAGKKPGNFSHPYYWAPFILIGNSL